MIHILGFPVKVPNCFKAYDILKYMNKTEIDRTTRGPMWIGLGNNIDVNKTFYLYNIKPEDIIGVYSHLEYNNENDRLIIYVKLIGDRYKYIAQYDNDNFTSYASPRMIIKDNIISNIITFDIVFRCLNKDDTELSESEKLHAISEDLMNLRIRMDIDKMSSDNTIEEIRNEIGLIKDREDALDLFHNYHP